MRAAGRGGSQVPDEGRVQGAEALRVAGSVGQPQQGSQREGQVRRVGQRGPRITAGAARARFALRRFPAVSAGGVVGGVCAAGGAVLVCRAVIRVRARGRARFRFGFGLCGAGLGDTVGGGDAVEDVAEREHAQLVHPGVRVDLGFLVLAGAGRDVGVGGQRGVGGQPVAGQRARASVCTILPECLNRTLSCGRGALAGRRDAPEHFWRAVRVERSLGSAGASRPAVVAAVLTRPVALPRSAPRPGRRVHCRRARPSSLTMTRWP